MSTTPLNHSQPAINLLLAQRNLAQQGTAFVLVGSGTGGASGEEPVSYSVGNHAPPVKTPLEAALAWLGDPSVYREIRLFCGCPADRLLPSWELPRGQQKLTLGMDEPVVFSLYGGTPSAPKSTASTRNRADDLMKKMGVNDPSKNPYALESVGNLRTWKERMEYFLRAVENPQLPRGTLFIVDDSWLTYNAQKEVIVYSPDALKRLSSDGDLPQSQTEAYDFERRFSAIPDRCRQAGLTVLLLMQTRKRAQDFSGKSFHCVQTSVPGDVSPTDRPPSHAARLVWESLEQFILLPTLAGKAPPFRLHMEKKPDSAFKPNSAFEIVARQKLNGCPDPLAELRQMIGMKSVIEQLTKWKNAIAYGSSRLSNIKLVGNPGTGKTTVAEIIARCLHGIGMVENPELVKALPDELIGDGKYAGIASGALRRKLIEAQGGVLFLDEFYKLHGQPYWPEISGALLPWIDGTKQIVVIVGGYADRIKAALSDPAARGLGSRFDTTINMPDYTEDELWEIIGGYTARGLKATLDPNAKQVFSRLLQTLKQNPKADFANARTAISLAAKAFEHAVGRISPEALRNKSVAVTAVIQEEDMLKVEQELVSELDNLGSSPT